MNQAPPSTRKLLKLAETALAKNKGDEAVRLYNDVLKLNPRQPEALHKLGFIHHSVGDYAVAANYYNAALAADPEAIENLLHLAMILQSQHKGAEAIAIAKRAIAAAPQNPAGHAMLVSLYLTFNQPQLVPDYLENLFATLTPNAELLQYYCFALKVNNRTREADEAYRKLLAAHTVPASFRIMYETRAPRVLNSAEEIAQTRGRLLTSLRQFTREKPQVNLNLLSYSPLFQLAYHNADNKELAQAFSAMLRAVAPELNYVAPHCRGGRPAPRTGGALRIGFLSRHMQNHSVGNAYRNLLLFLAAQPDVKATLFMPEAFVDEKLKKLSEAGVEFVFLPKNIPAAHQRVAEYALDILVYPDIGMDITTHYMAMGRLAHYQCCLTGHPDTTGIDTMDYYISSRFYEPENAQANYTETLLMAEHIDMLFDPPAAPLHWHSRVELGLPEGKKLYVCPMTIQKFHPDFDAILAGILHKDPGAVLVLFNDEQEDAASILLKERIYATCPRDRIIFLDWQKLDRFLSILKAADAVLVTIHFGAGITAQYAFALGVPMVTLPGKYLRGRIVHGYYKAMGVKDAPEAYSATGYVDIAVRLANDGVYKSMISKEILAGNRVLAEHGPYEREFLRMMRDILAQNMAKYQ